MLIRITVLLILLAIAGVSHATIIIANDRVNQQAQLTVLGNTYSTNYSGSVSGSNPATEQDISLVFTQDTIGNDVFSGISTDLNAPGALAKFYATAESKASLSTGYYEFRLNSDRWSSGFPNSPEADDAYFHHVQDSFIDFSLKFRVEGVGGKISMSEFVEFPFIGTADLLLLDHTAGMAFSGVYDFALADGHVYTAMAKLTNTGVSEHTVYSSISFSGDTVVMPTPSILMLFVSGLVSLGASTRIHRKRV